MKEANSAGARTDEPESITESTAANVLVRAYRPEDRDAREVPAAPRNTSHFHINVLPEARSVRSTRALIQAFLTFLHDHGHRSVYGQMVTFPIRRTADLFNRYGFRVIERVEVPKFRALYPGRVLLSTVVKDLSGGPWLRADAGRDR